MDRNFEGDWPELRSSYVPAAIYYAEADSVEYLRSDRPRFYRRIDDKLTLALDMNSREAIGFRVKGFRNFYLRNIKPRSDCLGDRDFVFLVTIIEKLMDELGAAVFDADARLADGYKRAEAIARLDRVELHDLPQAA